MSRLVAPLPTADYASHGCIVVPLSPTVNEGHTWNACIDKLDGVIPCSVVEGTPLYRSVALHRHLDTLRLLALALGPLLQQFISDTRLHQDTSVFVDAGVAQSMLSGEQQESPEDCADSCEAEFQQYDLGSYRGVRGPMQLATLTTSSPRGQTLPRLSWHLLMRSSLDGAPLCRNSTLSSTCTN